jgi:hypothetical protein
MLIPSVMPVLTALLPKIRLVSSLQMKRIALKTTTSGGLPSLHPPHLPYFLIRSSFVFFKERIPCDGLYSLSALVSYAFLYEIPILFTTFPPRSPFPMLESLSRMINSHHNLLPLPPAYDKYTTYSVFLGFKKSALNSILQSVI